MSYHQLTQYHRHELGALLAGGKHSLREVARILGFHHSTISREVRRHTWHNPSGYHAVQARLQLRQTRLRANQHRRKLSANGWLVAVVTRQLRPNWSPEQITGWLKGTGQHVTVCAQTIYDWLYRHARHLVPHLHCRKGRYRRTRENSVRKAFRMRRKELRHISQRPPHIERRSRYDHWEGDTVRGYGGDGYIATFVERKSGYLLAYKLERPTSAAFAADARTCFIRIAEHYRQTLTLDNGSEMNDYEAIEHHTGLHVFFATPYHS